MSKEIKSVNFTDLHDKMVQVTKNLITKTEFKKYMNENIVVKTYLPIASKYAIINVFSEVFKNNAFKQGDNKKINLDFIYLEYDISMLFDVMFFYTNIITSPAYKTTENYDLVKQSGLYNFILDKTNGDFLDTVEKCDRLTGIHNVSVMNELLNVFNQYPKLEEIEKMRDILNNEVDENKLKMLKDIETYNNPLLTKVLSEVKAESVEEIRNRNKKE